MHDAQYSIVLKMHDAQNLLVFGQCDHTSGTLNLPVTATDMSERRYSHGLSAMDCLASIRGSILK